VQAAATQWDVMKAMLLLSTAVAALTAASAVAGPLPSVISPRSAHHAFRAPASHLLYNQNSNWGYGIDSQNFSGSFSVYTSAAADDFAIPPGQTWRITRADAAGVYFNGSGPAKSEVVTFYADKKGRPGKTRASYTVNCADSRGNFVCKVPGPHGRGLTLSGGTAGKRYWLSVVANCDFTTCGQWGWVQNTKIRDNQGMWENPGNGFGTGCTTWGTNGDCVGLPGDYAFDIRGSKL